VIKSGKVFSRMGGRINRNTQNNSFESFLDTIDSIDLGIFEIEKAKEIVTPLEEEQQKLLKIFNIEKSLFTNIKLIKREFHRLQ
jgi:hypothetical protein